MSRSTVFDKEVAVFLSLCLLWARSPAPSSWDQLLPVLLEKASNLNLDILGHQSEPSSALELFRNELRSNLELLQKLQVAGVLAQPFLGPAFHQAASSSAEP